MSQASRQVLIGYLQQALDAPIGIEVETGSESNCLLLRQRLYRVIRDLSQYQVLGLVQKGRKLWIAKKVLLTGSEEPEDEVAEFLNNGTE